MTLLGKLLIVFNLLAAAGFVYLATEDWKGRQTINATAIRWKLPIVGLPLEGPDNFSAEDETPFYIEMAGGFPTETVSKKILELYFQSAPGGDLLGDKAPVPCQLAEVKRVRAKIDTLLKEKDAQGKVDLLKDFLIDQSETYEQRLEIQSLAAAGNAVELEKRLMAMFDAVLTAPQASVSEEAKNKLGETAEPKDIQDKLAKVAESRTKPINVVDRQLKIAQLLVFLNQDSAWQKRVVLVVGLRRYVNAIAVQAVRLRDMSARLEKLIITDQAGYLGQEANLNQLARDRTDLANHESKLKAEKVEQKKKEDDFVGQRETQLKAIQTQLLKIKAEVDENLAKQGQIETRLFEIQREVAITLDEVYQLEADLAARELELLKLKP
jgi:hypothetical protein